MMFSSQYYLVDIDGTLTDYHPKKTFEFLHGNFIFPIIRDMMVENGCEKGEAELRIAEFSEREKYWDYSDFVAEFGLSAPDAFHRMKQWHEENVIPYKETVDLIRKLAFEGRSLFIMSNNPYLGCLFKLQAAGLAENDFSSSYFQRIFGTNILRGCKSDPQVWKRAFAQIPVPVSRIGVIGDNPVEDRDIPRSLGVCDTILIRREKIVRGIDKK